MRQIRLREWTPQTERLTDAERDELLDAGLVRVTPLGDDRFELRSESIIGTAVGEHVHLLIRPKVGLANVFFLLSYADGLTTWRPDQRFPYEQDDDFFTVIAEFFQAEVTRAERHGLVRDYQTREETLTTLRGRLDFAAQIRRRQDRPLPIECRYQEYVEDIELNRILKAAFRRLLVVPSLELGLRRRLRHVARAFADVDDIAYAPNDVPDLEFTRLTAHWESPGRLAQLILRQESLRDRYGRRTGIAFSVDMNKVFERFLQTVVRQVARRHGWTLASQAKRALTPGVGMIPDLVLTHHGVDYAVADAKYKRLVSNEWPNADLYQMLAYCVGLGLPEGSLIYADLESDRAELVRHHGLPLAQLHLEGIDLSGPPQLVLQRTHAVARRLVARAQARYRAETQADLVA